MPNYQNGKIYKLTNTVNDYEYVGSTCQTLKGRKSDHRKRSRIRPDRKVYKELNEVGWDNVEIVLIENYPCDDLCQLRAREEHWRKENDAKLNSRRALRTHDEALGDKRRGYYENRDKILKQNRASKQRNREKNRAREKIWGQIVTECECGEMIKNCSMSNHKKTARHAQKLAGTYREGIDVDNRNKTRREYYEENKDKIRLQNRESNQRNKDKRNAYKLKWAEENAEKVREQKNSYYARAKNILVHCDECDEDIRKTSLSRHRESKRHLANCG